MVITGEAVARGVYELDVDAEKAERGVKSVRDHLGSLTKAATVAAAAVAGVGLALGRIVFTTSQNNVELLRMSQTLGTSVEFLSQQKYALEQSGVSLDDYQDAVVTLSERLVEAEEGVGTLSEFADRLGVDLDRLRRLTPTQALEELGDAIGAVRDPTLKAAAASEILGDVGYRLIPAFEEGSRAMAMARAEADALGATVTQSQAEASEAFQRNWGRIQTILQGVFNEITDVLIGPMNDALNAFSMWFKDNKEDITNTVRGWVGWFAQLAANIPAAFGWIVSNAPAIVGAIAIITAAYVALATRGFLAAIATAAASNPKIALAVLGTAAFGALGIFISQVAGGPGFKDVGSYIGSGIGSILDTIGGGILGAFPTPDAYPGLTTPTRPAGPAEPSQPPVRDVNIQIAPTGDLYTESTGGLASQIEGNVRRAISGGVLQAGIVPQGCVATRVAV